MLNSLLSGLQLPKRKLFTSYHHKLDQGYYDWLSQHLSGRLELFTDRALGEPVRSDDPEYVNRAIREEYIQGSSLTVVLCGAETYKRKYVDWEIYSTLHHQHALLGICLPTCVRRQGPQGVTVTVPDRLNHNINSGYAHWIAWDSQWASNPAIFVRHIETAIQKSSNKTLIQNSLPKMGRNSS